MYTFYLGQTMLPIAPESLEISIGNQNKTVTLINEGEINILKLPGLSEIKFEMRIPQQPYPFARGQVDAAYYLDMLERLKVAREPFQFICTRFSARGVLLFDTNIQVALEEYTIAEHADHGYDLLVEVGLKQYRAYGTKSVQVPPPVAPQVVAPPAPPRQIQSAPKASTHTVVSGDRLYTIAQQYLGDKSRWREIFALNTPNPIRDPNKIYPGQVLRLP